MKYPIKAFSLIEVIVALVVISGSLLVLLGFLSSALDKASENFSGRDNQSGFETGNFRNEDLELVVRTVEDLLNVSELLTQVPLFNAKTGADGFEKFFNWVNSKQSFGGLYFYFAVKEDGSLPFSDDVSTFVGQTDIQQVFFVRIFPAFDNSRFPKIDGSAVIEHHAVFPVFIQLYLTLPLALIAADDFDISTVDPDFSWTYPFMRFSN